MKRMLLLSIITVLGIGAIGFAACTTVWVPPANMLDHPDCVNNQCVGMWKWSFDYDCDDPEGCSAPTPDCEFVEQGHDTDLDWIEYYADGSCVLWGDCGTGEWIQSQYFTDACECTSL